jgi:ribosomal protein S27AE
MMRNICSVSGCEFYSHAKGLCSLHYSQLVYLRYGKQYQRSSNKYKEYKKRYVKQYYISHPDAYEKHKEYMLNYRRPYFKFRKDECERCGSTSFLGQHHRDRNRENNSKDNIETLCASCHRKEHTHSLPIALYT